MICPKCRAEYRPGFTVCADCGVALVEAAGLAMTKRGDHGRFDGAGRERAADTCEESVGQEFAAAGPGGSHEEPLFLFWEGGGFRGCTEVCAGLGDAEIPHKASCRQDHLCNF